MKKERYEELKMTIINFEEEDVLTTSGMIEECTAPQFSLDWLNDYWYVVPGGPGWGPSGRPPV